MGTYKGRLWLAPNNDSKVRVEVHLDDEKITITSNETVIGDWLMSEVDIGHVGNHVHLFVEDEQLVIAPTDPELVQALLEPGTIEEVPPAQGQEPTNESSDQPQGPTRRGAHKASRRMRWKW